MADKKDKSDLVVALIPGNDAVEAIKTPEGTRALYEDVCRALGIEPTPLDSAGSDDEENPQAKT